MSITIGGEEVVKPTEYSQKLRSELKEWEKAFAAANNGRKAGRDELKQYPEIASKYKEYAHLRHPARVLPSQASLPSLPPTKKRKRTPSPKRAHPSPLAPSIHHTPPPLRPSIGPTPQKNGLVLGLFDLLSRSRSHEKRLLPSSQPAREQTTPSKSGRAAAGLGPDAEASGGRFEVCLTRSLFLTPSARRVGDGDGGARTPGRVSKLVFDETPEFLRRGSRRVGGMGTVDEGDGVGGEGPGEEEVSWSPVAVRMPRKAAGRGLSVLVRGLRGLEEEMWDDEMDVLREVEAEAEEARVGAKAKEAGVGAKAKGARVLVGDSQVGEMPLGADGEGEEEESEDEGGQAGKGRDGRPLKVWKKKGQKRSTRRVVMKPVTAKWKPEPEWKGPGDGGAEDAVVAETQVVDAVSTQQDGGGGDDTGDEYVDAADSQATVGKKDGLVDTTVKAKRPPRKISSTAHANYRALKIKNKHSKGKGGGKFGRRR